MDTQKLGYTIDQAVDRSGLGRTSLFEAMREKRLTARKYGRRTIILAADLEAFLASLPVREAA